MAGSMPAKDPDDDLDYTINWATWLGADTIVSSVWDVPVGLTSHTPSNSTTAATIWLSGGTVGERYFVNNRIVTTAGRAVEDSFSVRIKDK